MKRILLVLAALFTVSTVHAAIAREHNIVRVTSMSFTATAPTAGNMLILTLRINGGVGTSVTGGGVTWTKVVMSSANRTAEIWCGANSTGPATAPIIIVSTNAGAAPEITYSEWSGLGDTCVVENLARTSGTSVNPVMGPISVLHSGALIIAKTSWAGNRSTVSTMDNSFTDLGVGDAGLLGRQGYRILTAPGSYSTQVTISASDAYDGVIAAFVPKEGLIYFK